MTGDELAELRRELQAADEREAAVRDVIQTIARTAFDLDAVLQTVIDRAVRLCRADNGNIARHDGDVYRVVAFTGFAPEYERHVRDHVYVPERGSIIGRVLIERKLIRREEMSMQRIREWMAAHPEEAAKVRATNRSYVFFRITGLSNEGEPVGAQGVPLTPGRSIAVDRLHAYGTPFFIEANLPIESAKPVSPFRRLMIAQDTGSAIVGPARADLYWGAGDDAGRIAGRIRHPGRFVMLVPRELDIAVAGSEIPLPVPKPKTAELEIAKKDDKGKVELADSGAALARLEELVAFSAGAPV